MRTIRRCPCWEANLTTKLAFGVFGEIGKFRPTPKGPIWWQFGTLGHNLTPFTLNIPYLMVSHASLICLVLALASAAEQNATTSLKIAPTPTLMVSAEVSAEIQAKSLVLATGMLAVTKVFDDVPPTDKSSMAASSQSHKKHTESVESFTCEFAFTYADLCLGVVDNAFCPVVDYESSAEVVACMGMTAWCASGNMNRFVSSASRSICARVYLPSVNGVVPGDTTTERAILGQPGVTVALPFVRQAATPKVQIIT